MSNQKELVPKVKNYLGMRTNKLLDEYGSGNHVPGSGSAAALSGLIAVEMLRTVCKLTLQKDAYVQEHRNIQYIQNQLENNFKPKLIELFNKDIAAFNQVYLARLERDAAEEKNEKERLRLKALNLLKEATEIPIQISSLCLEILSLALIVFDKGFKAVRGDSGVGVSNLLAAISSSLFVIFLNLKSLKKLRKTQSNQRWLVDTKAIAEDLLEKYNSSQNESFQKILELYNEGFIETDRQMEFEFIKQLNLEAEDS